MDIKIIELNEDVFQGELKFIPIKDAFNFSYVNYDRWRIELKNLDSFNVTHEEIYNSDTTVYFSLDTCSHDAFAHWVFESAIWLPELLELNQKIKSFKVLIKNDKSYKRHFLEYFNIDYAINPDIKDRVIIFPKPITSLNNIEVSNLYIKLLNNFKTLFINNFKSQFNQVNINNLEIKKHALILPRQKKENLKANDREVDSTDIQKYFIEDDIGSIFETDKSPNLQAQLHALQAAKYLIVPDGSAFLVNSFLVENCSIISLGSMLVPNQMQIYKKLELIYSIIIKNNHVIFINQPSNIFTRLHVIPYLNTLHIFGDSHGNYNFLNIKYKNVRNNYSNSTTMYRVGRDKLKCIDFIASGIKNNDVVIYQFGEVDCRCHIGKQILLGRELDVVISELVNYYIESIKINLLNYTKIKIIICCIPPTMNQETYEDFHGPITHEFPFIGTNIERSQYTKLVNYELNKKCIENNFHFLDYYYLYTNEEGTLKEELSDSIVHILDNSLILKKLYELTDIVN